MSRPIEITITYGGERLRFENDNGLPPVVIADARFLSGQQPEGTNGDCNPFITIKGPAETDDLCHQLTYRLYGRWSTYTNKRTGKVETQFHFDTFVTAQPHDKAGIIAYLAKAGEGLGVGRARAAQLYTHFGQEAVRVCRERPEEAAAAIRGWSIEDARTLAARLADQAHLEAVSIELTGLLANRGFPKATAKHAIDLWGNVATEIISRDPYRLMNFRGCGFTRCDRMYCDIGLPKGRLKRQALCAWYSIARDTDGHTWFPAEQAVAGIKANVSGCEINPARALLLAKRADMLSFQRTGGEHGSLIDQGGRLWVAETKKADHERFIAEQVAAASTEPVEWPDVSQLCGPSDHQRETLAAALAGPIAILGGSPGTGKTYTAASAILTLVSLFGADFIAVAAPTGKAAVRISEALDGYGVPLRARTIHSLLAIMVQPDGSWGFQFRLGCPLPFKFLIVDESSMIDTDLMASLLAARGAGTHVLFVGDINQLPPVGHGAPLRDLVAAGLPYGELREIRRNSGMIVAACAMIRDGRSDYPVLSLDEIDADAGRNLVRLETDGPDGQKAAMLRTIEWARGKGFDPVWDCQVLAAVNKKSPLSRVELNRLLQHELNQEPAVEGCPFRLRDKIVNTKNGRFKLAELAGRCRAGDSQGDDPADADDPTETYVANGDLAEVVEIEPKCLLARLVIGGKIIRIPRGKPGRDADGSGEADGDQDPDEDKAPNTGCSWDLAYCLSTHKSQGSEWPVVITLLDKYPGAMMVASREWLYTALSRGKRVSVEIGQGETARRMVRRVALGHRKTFLRELTEREICKVLVESL